LISVDLLLLLVVRVLLTLQLVTDQSAGAKAKAAADGRAYAGTTNGCPDQATRRRATEGADAGSFFTRG
jgi:hypothetical protein